MLNLLVTVLESMLIILHYPSGKGKDPGKDLRLRDAKSFLLKREEG